MTNDEPELLPGWYMGDARACGSIDYATCFGRYTGPMRCEATVYWLGPDMIKGARASVQQDRDRCEFDIDRKRPITNREIRDRAYVEKVDLTRVPLRSLSPVSGLGGAFASLLQRRMADEAEKAHKADADSTRRRTAASDASTYPWSRGGR